MNLKTLSIATAMAVMAVSPVTAEMKKKLVPGENDLPVTTVGGEWLHSAGTDIYSPMNPHYKFIYNRSSPMFDPVSLTLIGAGADAFLIVLDNNGNIVAKNDDYGFGSHARVESSAFFLGEQYEVIVGTFKHGEKGHYTLTTSFGELTPLPAKFKKVMGDAAYVKGLICGEGYRVASRQDVLTNKAGAKAELVKDEVVRLDHQWVVFGSYAMNFTKSQDEMNYTLCAYKE